MTLPASISTSGSDGSDYVDALGTPLDAPRLPIDIEDGERLRAEPATSPDSRSTAWAGPSGTSWPRPGPDRRPGISSDSRNRVRSAPTFHVMGVTLEAPLARGRRTWLTREPRAHRGTSQAAHRGLDERSTALPRTLRPPSRRRARACVVGGSGLQRETPAHPWTDRSMAHRGLYEPVLVHGSEPVLVHGSARDGTPTVKAALTQEPRAHRALLMRRCLQSVCRWARFASSRDHSVTTS
jgi:hypothetical protein